MIVARQNKEVISARSADVEGLGYRDDPRRYRELGARWGCLAKLHRDQQGVLSVREPRGQSPESNNSGSASSRERAISYRHDLNGAIARFNARGVAVPMKEAEAERRS
jgi:hypothetical protein